MSVDGTIPTVSNLLGRTGGPDDSPMYDLSNNRQLSAKEDDYQQPLLSKTVERPVSPKVARVEEEAKLEEEAEKEVAEAKEEEEENTPVSYKEEEFDDSTLAQVGFASLIGLGAVALGLYLSFSSRS
jgi:hypothetical protein